MELLIVVGVLIVGLYLLNKYFLTYWEKRGFNQTNPSAIFGDIKNLILQRQSIAEFFDELYQKHKHQNVTGIYNSYRPTLMISDPELIKNIMIRDFQSFHDRPMPVNEVKDPLSGHLFSLAGQRWRDLRVKLSPTFTSGKLKAMFSIMKDCGDVLDDYLVKNVKEGNNVMEFRDLLARFSTNIISSVAFGIDNDCINDPDHIFRKMGAKFFGTSLKNGLRNFTTFLMPELLYKLNMKIVDDDVEEFMFSVVKQTVEHREKTKFTRNDFMQLLIQLKNQGFISVDKGEKNESEAEAVKETGNITKLNLNELCAQAFVFFIAGFETTSSTMSFCLFELAKNSELQRKVQIEIDEVMKAAGQKCITYETMAEMKYLECCVDEALRKYPPVPILMRTSAVDYNVPGSKLVIPKGTSISIPAFSLHRDPDIYENPMEFKPERFLNNLNGSDKVKGLFYMPFGDGPRNCIGMRMGKLQSKLGLAVMLSKFSFELYDKTMADKELEFHPAQFVLAPLKRFDLKITCR